MEPLEEKFAALQEEFQLLRKEFDDLRSQVLLHWTPDFSANETDAAQKEAARAAEADAEHLRLNTKELPE